MNTRTTPRPIRSPEERTAAAVEMIPWQLDEVTDLLQAQRDAPGGLPVGGTLELEYTAWNGERKQMTVRRTK